MTIIVPSLRAIACAPGWVRNDLWRRARAVPSLDLRFAENKSLVDAISGQNLITFTRASGGTYVDSQGVLKTAATNEPRFDHNPTTGESLGLLVEEQRTNEVRNSNSMSAVATGSPGTLPSTWGGQGNSNGWTREIVGSGSIGNLNYVDVRFFGTPTTGLFAITFLGQGIVPASNGQSWAASVYHQLVGGSLSNVIGYPAVNLWDSTVSFLTTLAIAGSIVPTATMRRYTGAGTVSQANTAFINWGITFTCTVGNTYDFTIRFAGPQLELGAFPTSYIPTTGSAATRNADVASITGGNFSSWASNTAFTVFSEAASSSGAAYSGYVYTIGADFNNSVTHYRQADFQPVARIRTSSVDEYGALGNGAIWTGTSRNRFALALSPTSGRQASNGSLATAPDDSSITFPAMTFMSIGSLPGGILNGTIGRLTYWPQRLPNATLQSITQ